MRFKLHHLFAFSLLLTTLCQRPAQAIGLTFDLASQPTSPSSSKHPTKSPNVNATPDVGATIASKPLPIPAAASQPPVRVTETTKTLPENVLTSARLLTPPPTEALPTSRVLTPGSPASVAINQPIGLSFESARNNTSASTLAHTPRAHQSVLPEWIYEGGSDSLVARVIGSAEGTRNPHGQPTPAYYGHTDPGNGVWNMGTFSYQHGAKSPVDADKKQLKRLQRQGKKIAKQATKAEVSMTLGEILNGLDLANQAPKAALAKGGYVDRLAQARQQGIPDSEAIVWARTYAYLDPKTQRWDAPGLGNTLMSIKRDQRRRHEAISQAYSSYQAQRQGDPPADTWTTPVLAVAPSDPETDSAPISPQVEPISEITAEVEFSMTSHSSKPSPVQAPNSPETVISSVDIKPLDLEKSSETLTMPEASKPEAQS